MSRVLHVVDLGRRAYRPVLELQERLVEQRGCGVIPDTLLLVEHEPVYTLGRNAKESHVVASPEELARLGIEVVRASRGGDATYHGPGQLVAYPILDLGDRARQIAWYVGNLEEVIIRALGDYGLAGARDRKNRGVWIGDEKIAALGVRIAGHITMHGFALNARANLDHYNGIVPCGIRGKGVTSLDRFVPDVTMADAKEKVMRRFAEVFEYDSTEPRDPGASGTRW
ncbi:MAG: lipoyl(octanoyl) transferase LipB [Verrucomicrobiota bacterium]|nr:lipoyl(octanoyl) transferase LipB [Verrucomicrobiota bacterium]